MKKILFLLLIVASVTVNGQKINKSYPSYDEVVTHFFETYSLLDISSSGAVSFEKRPNGWFVVVTDFTEPTTIKKNEFLWSKEKGTFLPIDFGKSFSSEENLDQIQSFKQKYDRNYYALYPYYGYPGWDWDVIQLFKDSQNLSDSNLYALGRAYSSYASNLLSNNSGLTDNSKQFKLPKGKNCLTAEQLKEYRLYRHLAIQKFKQLSKQNPKFETIVGPIWIKTSNEYLTSFLDIRLLQNEKEAMAELADSLYTPFYISMAKNYLNSCAPNAILFTNGDNDTYPLLYVQAKYGFRPDVLVVNLSLLQTERYINSFREPTLTAPALPLSLTAGDISDGKKSIVYIIKDEENNKPIDISTLIEKIKNGEFAYQNLGTNSVYSPSNRFTFNGNNQLVEWYINKEYFFLNHLILLDIMSTSKMNRPIYFAISMDSEYFFGLNNYLQMEGLAYRLTTNKSFENNDKIGYINTSILYRNLMTGFDWVGISKATQDENLMCSLIRFNVERLADALITENKLDSAKIVLDKCLVALPNEKVFFDFYQMSSIAEDYYKIKQFETGNKILKQIVTNLHNREIHPLSPEDDLALMENYIKELARKYNQIELVKEIEK